MRFRWCGNDRTLERHDQLYDGPTMLATDVTSPAFTPEGSKLTRVTPAELLFLLLAIVALAIGGWHAGRLAWVNDDAFISFRYAHNLVLGRGLVFNPGERVEGYTNFLWTMMIAGGINAGLDPVPLSKVLGIGFHLLTIGLCAWHGFPKKGVDGSPAARLAFPLAALALSAHRDVNVYATSGLETSMFTFLVVSAFLILVRAESDRAFLGLGGVFAAMLMTRPDGIVFLCAAIAAIALLRERPVRRVALLLFPVFALYMPYWWWRLSYYGHPFPNTFYAKSADAANYANGIRYIGLYFSSYYAIPAAIGIAVIAARAPLATAMRRASGHAGRPEEGRALREIACVTLFIVLWLLYVLRIGGDFMFGRFLIPVTPLFYLGIAMLLTYAPRRLALALEVLIVAATIARYNPYLHARINGYIADEWQWYGPEILEENRETGVKLRRYFEGVPLRIGFGGMRCQAIYYADPELAIECESGLTDEFIAHQDLAARGRPGHEKNAPASYLVQRGVNFVVWSRVLPFGTYCGEADFGGTTMSVLVYNDSIMRHFAGDPTVRITDIPRRIDTVLATASTCTDENLLFYYDVLRRLYFPQNHDTVRQAAYDKMLRQRLLFERAAGEVAPRGAEDPKEERHKRPEG